MIHKIITMAYFRTLILVCLLPGKLLYGQIHSNTPQDPTFKPLIGGAGSVYTPQYQSPSPQVRMGATANTIRNRQANRVTDTQRPLPERKDITQLMQQIQQDVGNNKQYAPNPERTKAFYPALEHLKKMLNGDIPMSIADAYFTIENAFGYAYLTRPQYDSIIDRSIVFIKTWMRQNGLSLKDNNMVHYAIKKFMSEPLTIQTKQTSDDNLSGSKPITHHPFRYDYDDYQAFNDPRNTFATKCLATGFGQCASMPIVYLILAERLGVKAYLTFTPQHSFIKHPDNSGYIINYEPTSGWEMSDNWYIDDFHISGQAVKSGLYLDTLNTEQVIATCVLDLAVLYTRVDLTGKEDLILDCLKTSAPYFPKKNNLQLLVLYSVHLKTMLRETMKQYGITNYDNLNKVPKAKDLYKRYLHNEAYIKKLGYEDMPAGLYEAMLEMHDQRGDNQKDNHINGKQKRNLFITSE